MAVASWSLVFFVPRAPVVHWVAYGRSRPFAVLEPPERRPPLH